MKSLLFVAGNKNKFMTKEELKTLEEDLTLRGYRMYRQDHKNSTYQWFKVFNKSCDEFANETYDYQIGVLVYDWTKFGRECTDYSIAYWGLLSLPEISKFEIEAADNKMAIEKFESIVEKVYNITKS